MKKIILSVSLVLFCSSVSFGEIVSRVMSYNGPGNQLDQCNAITQDQLGRVYATGVSWGGSGTKEDYATIKFGEDGDFLWVARYDGPGHNLDYASAIAVDNSGNVYVTGWSRVGSSFGSEDYATIKYNSNGQQLWVARYNGTGDCYDFAKAIWVDAAGNIYITGISFGNNNAKDDYTTIKYNSNGVQQWVARYNGPSNKEDMAYSLYLDGSGNVYVTGASFQTNKGYDMLTIKYNNNGQQQWNARYNGSSNSNDIAGEVVADKLGNVFITGSSYVGTAKLDYVTIKYSSAGQQQWLKSYNGTANDTDAATGLDIDIYGNIYVTGYSKSSGGAGYDYTTIKYKGADGSQEWLNKYNGGSLDKAWDIKVFAKSCGLDIYEEGDIPCWEIYIYVTGQSTGVGTSNDFLTVRYSEFGNQLWANRFNGPANGNDAAYSISVRENYPIIYAAGSFANDYGIVGITEERPGDVITSGISKSYPNPFNPETRISFNVERESNVKIEVFDILGRTVATLVDKKLNSGYHSVSWNASGLNSGVYFYRIVTDYASETKKLVLVK
ncbi:MAG: SBBP repeat-containing protein [Chlorobi bacterium]|nr:SBBP repeat-containing protein [Chlorobiota bacterium]MCI0715138.1 SBBP repeat-containing protein [Chlorobiota bacterium]